MRGPQRRKRKPAPTVPKPVAAAPAVVVARFYCEQCGVTFGVGDESHTAHSTRELEQASRASLANHAVYWDEVDGQRVARMRTGMPGVDRVLGGGLVSDSIVLVIGETGAGKSTLLLQMSEGLLRLGFKVLVGAAEENAAQVGDRTARLKVSKAGGKVIHTTSLNDLVAEIDYQKSIGYDPDLVIVDSAQTIADMTGIVPGAAGDTAQVMHVGTTLTRIAKTEGRCIILVCQETKAGDMAGPQKLAHLVDVHLKFNMDGKARRFLIDPKNRFGPTNEVAIYDMTGNGLREIGNITEEQLEQRIGSVGVVPFATTHLARPVLLAIEASAVEIKDGTLTRPFDVQGYDPQKVRRVLDHLQEHCSVYIVGRAIRVRVPKVLGKEVDDEEMELAVAAALLSALYNRPPPKALVFGIIALSGQVFADEDPAIRLAAARDHKRLAFRDAIISSRVSGVTGVATKRISHIQELDAAMWGTHLSMPRPVKDDAEAA